ETASPSGVEADELAAALAEARAFLERQASVRRELFEELDQAIGDRKAVRVRALLARAEATVGSARSQEEDALILAAGTFLEEQKRNANWESRDSAPKVRGPKFSRSRTAASGTSRVTAARSKRPDPARAAHLRMRDLLSDLRRLADQLPAREVHRMVGVLKRTVEEAGEHVTALQRDEVDSWIAGTHTLHPAARRKPTASGPEQAAVRRVRSALRHLRRLPGPALTSETRRLIDLLEKDAGEAGAHLAAKDRQEVTWWIARASAPQSAEDEPTEGEEPTQQRGQERAGSERSAASRRSAATHRVGSSKARQEPARLPEAKVGEVAAAVRGALKKTARERSTTSWSRLRRQLGRALPLLHPDDQVDVLARVDADTPVGEPLLTALIAVSDTRSLEPYQRLARSLGRDVPEDASAARAEWQREVLQLYQLYRYQ
ncbi:hypothetical protein, partial [Streptomyces puniciscabiei]|uniref:hypothetical protein n=1 Tax=Streptomyces puniciscabiei TaxID=164348 RepID=UPI0033180C16